MALTSKTITVASDAKIELERYVDELTADLVKAWGRAWDEIVDEWEKLVDELIALGDDSWPKASQVIRYARTKQALAMAAERLDELAKNSGVVISRSIPQLIELEGKLFQDLTLTQLPDTAAPNWGRISKPAIDAMVKRTTQQIHKLTKPLSKDAIAAMRSELIRGVAVGNNPRVAARRMVNRVQGRFNGGAYRAEVIARTEMMDASREAAMMQRLANTELVAGWMWLCAMSPRTCPSCLSMHGREFPADTPGPQDHQCGRCVGVPVTRSWAELGFDDIDEPASLFPDARAWFNDQPRSVQLDIMGPARLKALETGKMSWDQMAVLKQNPGWRPSYVPRHH